MAGDSDKARRLRMAPRPIEDAEMIAERGR